MFYEPTKVPGLANPAHSKPKKFSSPPTMVALLIVTKYELVFSPEQFKSLVNLKV